ncbi:DUF418 domain-containing protein [Streptomyces sp. NPDC050804]|uniref:DUF418 domain-containing protein n=1 Tax=Streptomyces sp. NPDC050804 TaxID=3154745 RepID=UPI00341D27D1
MTDIDAVRGFALLGILLVNAQVISGAYYSSHTDVSGFSAGWIAAALTGVFAEMKFYLLFSFLFGYGVALRMRSTGPGRPGFTARYGRRLLALFLLGVCHAVVLFPGDILTAYAVLGVVVYFSRGLAPRTLVRVSLALVTLFGVFLLAVGVFAVTSMPYTPADAAAAAAGHAETASLYRGGPADVLRAHASLLGAAVGGSLVFTPHVLAALLAGLAAGKSGLLEGDRPGRDRLRRVAVRGLLTGVPGSVFMALCGSGPFGREWFYLGKAVGAVTAPALTAGYVCLLLLVWRAGRFGGARTVLAAAGRMSLTHYLTQSLVLAFVFTGYGLGLYGHVDASLVLLGCAFLYAAQLRSGAWLLARVPRGPLESLVQRADRGRWSLS